MNGVSPVRHSRTAPYPVDVWQVLKEKSLRVVVVYSVCYRFRMPIFRRLADVDGLAVKYLVGTGYPGTKITNAKDLSGVNVDVMYTMSIPVKSSGRSVVMSFNPGLLRRLIASKPDVIVVQGGELLNNAVTLLYAKVRRVPIVWWSLGEVRGRQFRGVSRLYRKLVQFMERRCDVYAAYSSVGVEYFLRQGIERNRIFNLVNVVDTDAVMRNAAMAADRVEALRSHLGLQNSRVILYVGAMTPEKNIQRLILAFSLVATRYPDVFLLLVGDGPDRKRMENIADGSEFCRRIVFVGDVFDEVSQYFLLSDLVVVPGTGGLVVSDAMSHGRPVIAAIGDGVEGDLIDHGSSGYLLQTDTVEELEGRLLEALSDGDELKKQGNNARARITDYANIDRYMNELVGAIVFAASLRN